mgnify:CR=1 FL=1
MGFACKRSVGFQSFRPLTIAKQAQEAIIFHVLRRFGGAVLLRNSRPSPSWGYPFGRLGLTVHRSRPPTASAELRVLAPLKNPFIQAHAYSNGIQFLKRCAALGLSFLWASPAGVTLVCVLFGLWPLRSKRKQLSFSQCCAASVAQCFSAVRARRQIMATRFGFWL